MLFGTHLLAVLFSGYLSRKQFSKMFSFTNSNKAHKPMLTSLPLNRLCNESSCKHPGKVKRGCVMPDEKKTEDNSANCFEMSVLTISFLEIWVRILILQINKCYFIIITFKWSALVLGKKNQTCIEICNDETSPLLIFLLHWDDSLFHSVFYGGLGPPNIQFLFSVWETTFCLWIHHFI